MNDVYFFSSVFPLFGPFVSLCLSFRLAIVRPGDPVSWPLSCAQNISRQMKVRTRVKASQNAHNLERNLTYGTCQLSLTRVHDRSTRGAVFLPFRCNLLHFPLSVLLFVLEWPPEASIVSGEPREFASSSSLFAYCLYDGSRGCSEPPAMEMHGTLRRQTLRNSSIARSITFSLWKYACLESTLSATKPAKSKPKMNQTKRYRLGKSAFLRISRAALSRNASIYLPIIRL